MKKLTSLFCATTLLLALTFTVARAAQPFYSCMTDGFGETWSIYSTPTGGGNWTFSGTVNVGLPSAWIISGSGNSITNSVVLTATNPAQDGCTYYTDYFTFSGYTYAGYLSGSWTRFCYLYGAINSGTWTGSIKKGSCGATPIHSFDGPALLGFSPAPATPLSNVENGISFFGLGEDVISISASPNPASDNTNVSYAIAKDNNVTVSVYNFLGQVVKVLVNEPQTAGSYSVNWDATDLSGASVPKGVYFLRAQTNEGVQTQAINIEK